MLYCFTTENKPDFISDEMKFSKKKKKAIIYDFDLDQFIDCEGNNISIKGRKIFQRTSVTTLEKLTD